MGQEIKRTDVIDPRHDSQMRMYDRFLDLFGQFQGDIESILNMFREIMPEITLVGYAEKTDNERLRISHVIGDCGVSPLLGHTLSIGEGYLGQVALTEKGTHWKCLAHDPRLRLFTACDIRLLHLYGFPVRAHDELAGVLFYGSAQSESDHCKVMHIGRMTSHLWGSWLTGRYLQDELELQRSRLTILIEVAKVLDTLRDARRVMFLLVDMTLNLIHDAKAALVMVKKPHEQGTFELVSRGFTKEQADDYSKYLAYKHWLRERWMPHRFEEDADQLKYLDCAMTVQGEIIGVLAVMLGAPDHYPNSSQELLATLSYMGCGALKHLQLGQTDAMHKQVNLLHRLLQRWDPKRYKQTWESSAIAEEFGKYMHWDEQRVRTVCAACRLAEYDPSLLREADIPDQVLRLLTEYKAIRTQEADAETGSYDAGIVYLADRYAATRTLGGGRAGLTDEAVSDFRDFLAYYECKQGEIRLVREEPVPNSPPLGDLEEMSRFAALSPREREVLGLIAAGKNNREIAQLLYISENTVKNHITSIFNKTGVTDRVQLMAKLICSQ